MSEIYLHMANEQVAGIMRIPEGVTLVEVDDEAGEIDDIEADVITLGIHEAIAHEFKPSAMLHPTMHLFALAGLDIPDTIPQPLLDVPEDDSVPVYDYLIAPWSLDDPRSLNVNELRALVDALNPDAHSIGILGAQDDPRPLLDVFYEYGRPLAEVVTRLRRCKKAVITCDSAMSRLSHAAGIRNHLVMGANVGGALSPGWIAWPGCVLVYAQPHQWRLAEVLEGIGLAEENGCRVSLTMSDV